MAFIDARLLDCVSYGFTFGPEFRTTVMPLLSGSEARNAEWMRFRWRGTAPYRSVRPNDYHALLGAFLRTKGMAHTFRFRNWFEALVTAQSLGAAPSGSTPVQLVRDYSPFGGQSYRRTVTAPVAGTVTVYQAGVAKPGAVDTSTGLFTPATAWTAGAALTADFEYDVVVRFDSDHMPFSYENWQKIGGEIPLVEVL